MPIVFLCHFDGTNGSTSFTDVSPSAHPVAPGGGVPALTTTSPKFGTACLNSPNAGDVVTVISTLTDFNFGAGQFTIECWANSPTAVTSGLRALTAQWSSSFGWWFGFNNNALTFFYSTTGSDNPSISGTYSPGTNTWVHYAVDRDASNVLRVYANGAVITSATVAATFFASTVNVYIGNDGAGIGRGWQGTIDEVRVTKGTAQYGGAFTPPTGPFNGAVASAQARVMVMV